MAIGGARDRKAIRGERREGGRYEKGIKQRQKLFSAIFDRLFARYFA
jgi:hypothetical protein